MGLWPDVHHDFEAGAMSYHDIVAAVAAMAWEYPYFTWDEAGLGPGSGCLTLRIWLDGDIR